MRPLRRLKATIVLVEVESTKVVRSLMPREWMALRTLGEPKVLKAFPSRLPTRTPLLLPPLPVMRKAVPLLLAVPEQRSRAVVMLVVVVVVVVVTLLLMLLMLMLLMLMLLLLRRRRLPRPAGSGIGRNWGTTSPRG